MKLFPFRRRKSTQIVAPRMSREQLAQMRADEADKVVEALREQQIGYDPDQPMPVPREVAPETIYENLGLPRIYVDNQDGQPVIRTVQPLVPRTEELSKVDELFSQGIAEAIQAMERADE